MNIKRVQSKNLVVLEVDKAEISKLLVGVAFVANVLAKAALDSVVDATKYVHQSKSNEYEILANQLMNVELEFPK